MRIGTAGWTLPRQWQSGFPLDGSHLERYAAVFNAVEVNSSFYRAHSRSTWARWAASVPGSFRFAVKVPRAITHDQRLVASDILLDVFLHETEALGHKLGPLLVQLPPSLDFHAEQVEEFLVTLRARWQGAVALEPRNAGWFTATADDLLVRFHIARAGADPARVPEAALPGAWPGLHYLRLHGSPRMYYSAYTPEVLRAAASALQTAESAERWCMFDNTTLGAATGDALSLAALLRD